MEKQITIRMIEQSGDKQRGDIVRLPVDKAYELIKSGLAKRVLSHRRRHTERAVEIER